MRFRANEENIATGRWGKGSLRIEWRNNLNMGRKERSFVGSPCCRYLGKCGRSNVSTTEDMVELSFSMEVEEAGDIW